MFSHKLLIAVASVSTLIVAGGAAAQPRDVPSSEVVRLSRADVTEPGAVKTVYSRLWRAAKTVCDSGHGRNLKAKSSDRQCAEETLDRTIEDLRMPRLSAYHNEKAGKTASVFAAREVQPEFAAK